VLNMHLSRCGIRTSVAYILMRIGSLPVNILKLLFEITGYLKSYCKVQNSWIRTLCDMVWCDMTWRDVMWCDVLLRDVTWRDVLWSWRVVVVMWRDVMWCDVMWCDVMWQFGVLLRQYLITCSLMLLYVHSSMCLAHVPCCCILCQ
jgi:hypothetical protein